MVLNNYKEENIVILTDNTEITPTKENMMNALTLPIKEATTTHNLSILSV